MMELAELRRRCIGEWNRSKPKHRDYEKDYAGRFKQFSRLDIDLFQKVKMDTHYQENYSDKR